LLDERDKSASSRTSTRRALWVSDLVERIRYSFAQEDVANAFVAIAIVQP